MNNKAYLYYYFLLSLLAGIILILIVFIDSNQVSNVKSFFEKQIIAAGFLIASVFGLSCSWFPGWYKTTKTKKTNELGNEQKLKRKRRGHHPDCHYFKDHIIHIKNKIYCAGCLGISIGLLCSIILMMLYLLIPMHYSITAMIIIFVISLLVIPVAFIEILYQKKKIFLHIILHAVLIISFFLLTITTYEITGDVRFGFIALIFSFLFLRTRIECSKTNHTAICNSCNESCKMY